MSFLVLRSQDGGEPVWVRADAIVMMRDDRGPRVGRDPWPERTVVRLSDGADVYVSDTPESIFNQMRDLAARME